MTNEFEARERAVVDLVADIVAAYVSSNSVASGDMPAVIECVQAAIAGLADRQPVIAATPKATGAQIRSSITHDALISFIDGKPYKALRRHLTGHRLDPQTYRQRYGLPVDYPMVAPSYSARRSEISRSFHIGKRG
ncbi:MucR family transcriptional regulator [Methylobacterium persicinum]|uniref:Transcriptional regulator n=1 Tax=Methylobacterium persicinum TaxID=374426 RepID=A0ABU0HQF3_9HYPH|nr:MucR family transcriptional regulator [Methylobacterium persicinum]MDQ0444562.1 putative transcriptional regulator [Methylobacterium persicinum]GJE40458.1 Transcriptional regulatory protein ros [Methylobacterium persicinum]